MTESRRDSATRGLSDDERAYVAAARAKANVLYEGVRVPHRSCGIAIAETFGLPTPSYQSLRRRSPGTRSRPSGASIAAACHRRSATTWSARTGTSPVPAARAFCTSLAAQVADLTAEALVRFAPTAVTAITPVEES